MEKLLIGQKVDEYWLRVSLVKFWDVYDKVFGEFFNIYVDVLWFVIFGVQYLGYYLFLV